MSKFAAQYCIVNLLFCSKECLSVCLLSYANSELLYFLLLVVNQPQDAYHCPLDAQWEQKAHVP